MLSHFYHKAGLIPLPGVQADLILDAHHVAYFEWWELASVFGPALCLKHVAVA